MPGQSDRCPNCGALVAARDEWCGQCFRPLRAIGAPAGPTSVESPVSIPPVAPQSPGQVSSTTERTLPGGASGNDLQLPSISELVKQFESGERTLPSGIQPRGADPTWTCPTCQHSNPLELTLCAACGTSFGKLFEDSSRTAKVDPATASRASIVPGRGHWICGFKGEAVARAGFIVWGIVAGVFCLAAARSELMPIGILYLGGAIGAYIEGAIDAGRVAAGRAQMVTMKMLMYVFAGLIFVMVISVMLATIAATNHTGPVPLR